MSRSWIGGVVCVLLLAAVGRGAGPGATRPVELILDTDMSGDCDDAGTLALLHTLADRGECRIHAVLTNRKDKTNASAAAVDVINTFYGRPNIPIGTEKGGPTALQRTSAYAAQLRDGFPNDIGPDDRAPDALEVYRKMLAGQADNSVVICSVGALSNLADLCRQEKELVRKKVRLLVVMGGEFPRSTNPETNIKTHREASQVVAEQWPTPIVWHGYEVGNALITGAGLKQVAANNPVRRAYELKPYAGRPAIERGQPSWDQGAALFAVRGAEDLWELSGPGRVRIDDNGNSTFEPAAEGRDTYVIIKGKPARLTAIIEQLMAAPPATAKPQ